MSRTAKQQQERFRLFLASMAFANNRSFAVEMAAKGNRDAARFWGSAARRDWAVIQRLLTC
jgi:hypothetical protein